MSEIKLKRCPCCDGEALLCDPLKEEAFIYIPQVICSDCGLEVTAHTVESVVEKWNARKPMEQIVERLEELDDLTLDQYNRSMAGTYEHDFADGKSCGLELAIEIVKEVGEMNENRVN